MSIQTKDGKLYLHYDEDGSRWEVIHASEHALILFPMAEAIKAGHAVRSVFLHRTGDAVRIAWYDEVVQAFEETLRAKK